MTGQRSHAPRPRPVPRAGQAGGQGWVFTGSFNQVPIFKSFLLHHYLLTLIVPRLLRCSPGSGPGGGLPLIACVLPVRSRAGPFPHGLPEPRSRGAAAPMTTSVPPPSRGRPSVQYHVTPLGRSAPNKLGFRCYIGLPWRGGAGRGLLVQPCSLVCIDQEVFRLPGQRSSMKKRCCSHWGSGPRSTSGPTRGERGLRSPEVRREPCCGQSVLGRALRAHRRASNPGLHPPTPVATHPPVL